MRDEEAAVGRQMDGMIHMAWFVHFRVDLRASALAPAKLADYGLLGEATHILSINVILLLDVC